MTILSRGLLILTFLRLSLGLFSSGFFEHSNLAGLNLHATIESIGVVAGYSGDNNGNNQAEIEYRVTGSSSWLSGPDMMVDRAVKEWRVSLVHLSPDTSYEIQVVIQDPDGDSSAILNGNIWTRPDYPSIGGSGNTLYVPDDGSLQKVIDKSNPGDLIRIRSGIYYQSAIIDENDSGAEDAYLTIEAEPGGKVIFDGSDPNLNNPDVNNWKNHSGNIYFTDLNWGNTACDEKSVPGFVGEERGGEGVRYFFF